MTNSRKHRTRVQPANRLPPPDSHLAAEYTDKGAFLPVMSKTTIEQWRAFPKVVRAEMGENLSYRAVQLLDPSIRFKEYRDVFNTPSIQPYALITENVDFVWSLLQTKEALRIAIKDILDQFAGENVLYAEIRLTPFRHTEKSLTPKEVVETVLKAIRVASKLFNIQCGLVLCTQPNAGDMETSIINQLIDLHDSKSILGHENLHNTGCLKTTSSSSTTLAQEHFTALKQMYLAALLNSIAPDSLKQEIASSICSYQAR